MAEPEEGQAKMAESSGWSSWLLNLVYTGATLMGGALVLLYIFQEKLLYFPTIPGTSKFTKDNPKGYRNPGEFSIDYEDLMIRTKDGIHLHAWLMKQPEPHTRPTLIFFHGNAGNIGYRLPNAVHLYKEVKCNVLLVDYRGFGHSEGEPSEEGLKIDSEAVLEAMLKRTDVDKRKLVVFGRSLGGAVSVYLAQKTSDKIAGVILENTFLSIGAMVDTLMPYLRYFKPLILRMDWNNARAITTITQPILFVAGVQDELVPHIHMKQLHALAKASRKPIWYTVPNGTHNDTWLRGGDKYFETLRRFLESLTDSSFDAEDATSCDTSNVNEQVLESVTHEGSIPAMYQQPLLSGFQSKKAHVKDEQ
ncbi:hypothetical protein Poli38472_014000 [Pythium oligandrum]|uniref:AB hydrolase-1 domain-containing protein n=1 Tax=Pythium oligandrum TaxID=41045 RepID=A0A8K1FQK6_PYTOL|nr:hypothetical protein Poli38472_014000 [Pythium oligandrum]|eukprot:TMW66688.1 hypothetical protein Poli38472_014000 [Pythium oligandrum]